MSWNASCMRALRALLVAGLLLALALATLGSIGLGGHPWWMWSDNADAPDSTPHPSGKALGAVLPR